jgi:hydrogenase maturation protein HypF
VQRDSAPRATDGRRIDIRGIVQGVGFRPWVFRLASARGLGGWVRNDASGVTIEVFGTPDALDAFLADLDRDRPPAARLDALDVRRIPPSDMRTFTIVGSAHEAERRVSIPADLPTCARCLAEIREPADRRHRYAFTNCTDCGPRFTIARDVPYDRPQTTMAAFTMCAACQAEYDDPASRRFHAQPNGCPACGPRLWAAHPDGTECVGIDAIALAAAALCDGRIVAIKGLGGFHLACDAGNTDAVSELRHRKRRDEKPFAVMAADLGDAERLASLGDEERRLLTSLARPIVLAHRRADAPLASTIAPGNPLVGVMLPYTPIHHLLLDAIGRPLVMTSGNMSDEPIVCTNDEAFTRLGRVADLFLLHDRDIDTRCDDSVARVIAGAPVVLRRSRGYVPLGVPVLERFEAPVLACGALLKNTFGIGLDDHVVLGPHIGDLESLETFEAYEHAIGRMTRFLGVEPAAVAYDLHPEYLSSRYARAHPAREKIGVQHHHAHAAAVMAEHGLAGPVLAIAFDGTGFGPDGAAWGGEILVVEYGRFERRATLRPLGLAGGDAAIRQVWRQALSLVDDAFGGDAPIERIPVLASIEARELDVIRQMLRRGVNVTRAHGAGRYFDAAAALGLGRAESGFEGQAALEWNLVADPAEDGEYEFALSGAETPIEVDLRACIRSLVNEISAGIGAATVSARFHNTLARATAEAARCVRQATGPLPVVLTGGVFQNARLAEALTTHLAPYGPVFRHGTVPPGDGGIALGQAVVANAILHSRRLAGPEDVCA